MKIACVIESLVTFGGTQLQCIRVAEHLMKQGHQVQIITTSFERRYGHNIEDGLNVTTVKIGSEDRMSEFAGKITDLVQDNEWLIVFDWDVYRIKNYLPSKQVCWICNDPPYSKDFSGTTGIGGQVWFRFSRIYGIWKEMRFIKKLNCILVLDNKNKEFLRRKYGVESTVVRSGIDGPREENPEEKNLSLEELSGRYHLVKRRYILTIGIAYRHRNFEVLIKAMRNIRDGLGVLIVAPCLHDKRYVADLKNLAAGDERIQIEDKFISEEEKQVLLANALCFVFPNKNQTWGLAPLEALMHGTIPIISHECGVAEVLKNNEHALHFQLHSKRYSTIL